MRSHHFGPFRFLPHASFYVFSLLALKTALGRVDVTSPELHASDLHDDTDMMVQFVLEFDDYSTTIPAVIYDGFIITEGDIILARLEDTTSLGDSIWIQQGFNGTVELLAHNLKPHSTSEDRIWDCPIPYKNSLSSGSNRVTQAIEHWETYTPWRFVERTNQKDYVNFVDGSGCSSYIGKTGGKQEINIKGGSGGCSTGNIIHELAHAIGFWHEHTRWDRDNWVKVHEDCILPNYEHNFSKTSEKLGHLCGLYDYGSILHYSQKAFAKSSSCLTIETIQAVPAGVRKIGQRDALSCGDIQGGLWRYDLANTKCSADNSICGGATPLTVPSTTIATLSSDGEVFSFDCGKSVDSPVLWYRLEGSGARVKASTCTSEGSLDTVITVFKGCCAQLSCLVENDNSCAPHSEVTINTDKDVMYFIAVHGKSTNSSGDIRLTLGESISCNLDVLQLSDEFLDVIPFSTDFSSSVYSYSVLLDWYIHNFRVLASPQDPGAQVTITDSQGDVVKNNKIQISSGAFIYTIEIAVTNYCSQKYVLKVTQPWLEIFHCDSSSFGLSNYLKLSDVKKYAKKASQIIISDASDPSYYVKSKSETYPIKSLRKGYSVSYEVDSDGSLAGYADQTKWTGTAKTNNVLWNNCGTPTKFYRVPYVSCGNPRGLSISDAGSQPVCSWTSGGTDDSISFYIDVVTDECPSDPLKTAPGICGCNVAETDSDNDGTPDCIDECPNEPTAITLPCQKTCSSLLADSTCCANNECSEGEGMCKSDDECSGNLICGVNNCGANWPSFKWDCCAKASSCTPSTVSSSSELIDCCSSSNQCGFGEGNCESDDDCLNELICGDDNCDQTEGWNSQANCCKFECNAVRSDLSCCNSRSPCVAGEGDCDSDDDCVGDLQCGSNNCNEFETGKWASVQYDCCEEPKTSCTPEGSESLSNCCTSDSPCGVGEGDCDKDDHCEGSLVCGRNNCGGTSAGWPFDWYDCCEEKELRFESPVEIDDQQDDSAGFPAVSNVRLLYFGSAVLCIGASWIAWRRRKGAKRTQYYEIRQRTTSVQI